MRSKTTSTEKSDTHRLDKVVCIMGPTASGKTKLAIEAAKILNGEVISVDSALVYKDMNIGTAKPTLQEQGGIAHHLMDIILPTQSYSVSDFLKDAKSKINQVLAMGKLPILAGGTMMYFNAMIKGINSLPASDKQIRAKLSAMPLSDVYNQLKQVDPESAARIHSADTQRLIRALEVYISSNKTLTQWQQTDAKGLDYNFAQFSIMPKQRSRLHMLIEQRFDLMLQNGFVEEVKQLLNRYELHEDMPAMRCVGYRQVLQHLNGLLDYDEMRDRGIISTRQLAKRQITWLRSWDNMSQLYTEDNGNLDYLVQKVGAT